MSHRDNLLRIRAVYNALGDLQQEVIFVGGATVSLYADRRAYELEIRPTNDIDILVEIYEAFKNRGGNDGRTSTDFEDIVFVLENRSAIWEEMRTAPLSVRNYLRSEFGRYLNNSFFEEWVDAHSGYGSPPATYYILEQLEQFVKGSGF